MVVERLREIYKMADKSRIRLSWLAEQTLEQAEKELFSIPRYECSKEITSGMPGKDPFLVGPGVYLPSSGTKLRVV